MSSSKSMDAPSTSDSESEEVTVNSQPSAPEPSPTPSPSPTPKVKPTPELAPAKSENEPVEAAPADVAPVETGNFANAVQACTLERITAHAHVAPPRCYSSLQAVSDADALKYKKSYPQQFEALEARIADSATALHQSQAYRHFGLYAALLIQGVDMFDISDGTLSSGDSGEVCQRVGAVIKQALRARDARASTKWPFSTVVSVTLLGFILILCIAILVFIVLRWVRQ